MHLNDSMQYPEGHGWAISFSGPLKWSGWTKAQIHNRCQYPDISIVRALAHVVAYTGNPVPVLYFGIELAVMLLIWG